MDQWQTYCGLDLPGCIFWADEGQSGMFLVKGESPVLEAEKNGRPKKGDLIKGTKHPPLFLRNVQLIVKQRSVPGS